MSSNGSNKSNSAKGGIGFCGLLTIAFIILKLVGVIKWSWLWVLVPLWLPTTIMILIIILIAIFITK